MATFILSILIIAVIIGLLVLPMVVDRGRRGGKLRILAHQQGYRYQPYVAADRRIRSADFLILTSSQYRHCPHFIEGTITTDHDTKKIIVFDCTVIAASQTYTQTLIIVECPLAFRGRIALSYKRWLTLDTFTDQLKAPLKRHDRDDKPSQLASWSIQSEPVHHMKQWLSYKVIEWLLAHPHLHIEWSDGMLLACQPGALLDAEDLLGAIQQVNELSAALTQ